MLRAHRYLPAMLLASAIALTAPACAAQAYGYRVGGHARDLERIAYDNGYRDGLRNGEHDARDRREFRIDRDRDFRNADDGFRRGEGLDREQYRRVFRQAYEVAYTEGFNRIARPHVSGREYEWPAIILQTPATYPDRRVVTPGGGFVSPAARNGYRDGVEAGRNDARDRERFDPIRAKRYREGDHDYDNRFGSRDEYKREYRAAFEHGYREGFGEGRR